MTAGETPLTPETETKVQEIGETDVLVGIPSYNNTDTIGHVVRAVSAGLAKYFARSRVALVNSDGGSSDGTPEAVARAAVDLGTLLISEQQSPLHKSITPDHGVPGTRSACRPVF